MAGQRLPFFRARLSSNRAGLRLGWNVGSSPTPIREGRGRLRRRRCTPFDAPSTPEPRRSSSTSTPPPTVSWWCATTRPSTAPPTAPAPSPRWTWDELRTLDNAYWWAPGADVTPGTRARPVSRSGDVLPTTGGSGSPCWRRCSTGSPTWCSTWTSSRRLRSVAPYEQALAALLRRFGRVDDVIVASFLDSATDAFSTFAPEIPTSAGTVAVAGFFQSVQAGETPAPMRHVALQVPAGLRRRHPRRPAFRGRGPPTGAGRPRVDDRGGVGDGAALRAGGGRHHHRPTHRPGRGARSTRVRVATGRLTGLAWPLSGGQDRRRGVQPAGPAAPPRVSLVRSSASCRGWPSSWPGACACWFVSTQFGGWLLDLAPTRVPGGRPVTWLLRDGDVLAAAEVADRPGRPDQGTAGSDQLRGSAGAAPHPVGTHLRHAVPHRRGLLRQGDGGGRGDHPADPGG